MVKLITVISYFFIGYKCNIYLVQKYQKIVENRKKILPNNFAIKLKVKLATTAKYLFIILRSYSTRYNFKFI